MWRRAATTAPAARAAARARYGPPRRRLATAATVRPVASNELVDDRLEGILPRLRELTAQVRSTSVEAIPDLEAAVKRPARLAVVGGSNTGKSMLVNLLLDRPTDQLVTPQGLAKDRHYIYRIRYGPKFRQTPDARAKDVIDVEAPVPWLEQLEPLGGLEITDTPGYGAWTSGQASVDAVLENVDAVLLVTDCSRQLIDTAEVQLLRRLADKRPNVVLNQIDRVLPAPADDTGAPSHALTQVVARVRASIDAALLPRRDDGFVLGDRLPIFALSTKRAYESLALAQAGKDNEASYQWSKSGLDDLRDYLVHAVFRDTMALNLLKYRSLILQVKRVAVSVRGSLERRRLLLEKKAALLEAVRERTLEYKDVFTSQLHEIDLAAVDRSLVEYRRAIADKFDEYPVWQLILQYETLGAQIHELFERHNFHPLESQMVYAVGRMNEGNRGLLERVERAIGDIASDPVLATHAATEQLSAELVALRDGLAARRKTSNPTVLARHVWDAQTRLNASALCAELQRGVTRRLGAVSTATGLSAATAAVAYSAGLSVYSYGSITALTAGIAAAGYLYLQSYWNAQEDRLINAVTRVHHRLRNDVAATATAELNNVTLQLPLTAVIEANTLLHDMQEWVQARREECDTIVDELSRLEEDVQRSLYSRATSSRTPSVRAIGRPGRQPA